MKQSSKCAIGGIVAAVSLVLMISVAIIPFLTYALPAVAGLFIVFVVIEIDKDYIFNKVEHTVSAEAMLVDAMVSGDISSKEAVAAVLADENNSYSKNELKAAALRLKKLFGE